MAVKRGKGTAGEYGGGQYPGQSAAQHATAARWNAAAGAVDFRVRPLALKGQVKRPASLSARRNGLPSHQALNLGRADFGEPVIGIAAGHRV